MLQLFRTDQNFAEQLSSPLRTSAIIHNTVSFLPNWSPSLKLSLLFQLDYLNLEVYFFKEDL